MKTAAIICEYNPFHSGHEYHIRKIREELGEDTAIVAVMSGNYTQRGDVAIVNKHVRAKCAILGGVDLVIELPFPFSSSSAEFFARSAVSIASNIGVCDYLSFGSESGDISALFSLASVLSSESFSVAYTELAKDKTLGHPKLCELAAKRVGFVGNIDFTPNNILAVEYIRAINALGSALVPHTVLRSGAGYNDLIAQENDHPSALLVREMILNGVCSDLPLPDYCKEELALAFNEGQIPCELTKISAAIITHLRLTPPEVSRAIHDAQGGLYNRLYKASLEASDITKLSELTETKGYTNARIRRVLLYALFGVTSSDVRALPEYTQVLAMSSRGMLLLKEARKRSSIGILTKPSAIDGLSELAIAQKKLSDTADGIYELTKPTPKSACDVFRFSPFIKK